MNKIKPKNKKILEEIYGNRKQYIGGWLWDMDFPKSEKTRIKSIKQTTCHHLIVDGEEYMADLSPDDKIKEIIDGYRFQFTHGTPISIYKKDEEKELIFPFGRFRNKRPDQIPNSYLEWVLNKEWFNEKYTKLSNECAKELDYRNRYNIRI